MTPVVGSGTAPSPDGSLLGWLAANYPDTYAAIGNAPRETSRAYDTKDSSQRRKRRIVSPTTLNQDTAVRPISTRTRRA
jgi:hypothetical protein